MVGKYLIVMERRENYVRGCSLCHCEIYHLDYYSFVKGVVEKKMCRQCAIKNRPVKKCSCEKCKKGFTYKTSKPPLCKECQQEKVKNEIGTKTCSQCNSIITYKSKYDRILAEKNNTICSKCVSAKNTLFQKGKTLYDTWIEQGMSHGEAKEKWNSIEKKRLETRKGYCHSEETLGKILKGSFTQHFKIEHLDCQGNWERMYIEGLVKSNLQLPNNGYRIQTPFGNYVCDFDFNDRIIEIKSKYTFEIFNKLKLGWGKKISIQKDKVEWVGKNIKPVQLLVLGRKGELLEEVWFR